MQAYEIREPGSPDSLVLHERPEPEPGYGQVLVRVSAASLNFRDLMVAKGIYSRNLPARLVPLSDGAGEVVGTGPGVSRWKTGDRVAAAFMQTWISGPVSDPKTASALGGAVDGVLAELAIFHEDGLVRIPDHLSYEEAATLPCAAVTAWNALFVQGNLEPGQSVLLLGSGGVSVFALQFARLAGARIFITSGSEEKLKRLGELGAEERINYKAMPEWDRKVLELTGRVGVDHVVEVGGAGTLERSLKAVRAGGTVSLIGVLTGPGQVDPTRVLMKSIRVQGIYVGSRDMFEAMNRAIAQHHLHPVVDRVFPFAEAVAAYRYLESGEHLGKVVIQLTR